MSKDFRNFIEELEKTNEILHVKKQVSSEYEACGVLRKTKGILPICFEKIDNYKCPMVCSLGGSRELLARSLGIEKKEIIPQMMNSIVNPIRCNKVKNAKVHENVVLAPFDVSEYFPVLKYYEKDAGRFFISGIMVAKDMQGNKTYTSIRRMQYLGGNKFTILITSIEMKHQFKEYEQMKTPMDIAIMFGVHPAVMLGSQISTHLYNIDKLNVTSALIGEPLDIVKGKTVDLDVLADAEVVFEGKVYQWEKATEGPFGEMAGYYGKVEDLPIVEFTAMTYRNNPIFQTVAPGGYEEKLSMALPREVALLNAIKQTVPSVLEVNITIPAAGRYHAIIKIKKNTVSDGRQASLVAFSADKDLKHVVVVDEDVDIFDPEDVEWAIATRVQADKDIFIIGGMAGSPLEASFGISGTSAKMGIDATSPIGDNRFDRIYVPNEENINLKDYIGGF